MRFEILLFIKGIDIFVQQRFQLRKNLIQQNGRKSISKVSLIVKIQELQLLKMLEEAQCKLTFYLFDDDEVDEVVDAIMELIDDEVEVLEKFS